MQTYIKYPLTNKLSAFFNIRADKIPSSAYRSPLVNNKFIYSGLASLIYTFTY
ncbi:MAG TPA: MipA/OmpV family protein, partial [Sulfurimonas autotrophica]|nr:MipA/OmpV family protein [Sulfurimonas autotrophica]